MKNISEVVVLEDAALDMEENKAFYEYQRVGLGDYFWDSIISDIESLIIFAGVHQRDFDSYRMLSKRFPYAIYYEIENVTAIVLAVLPVRADPKTIAAKIQERH